MPKVSVIVAAYESHLTIEDCLRSLRAQTFSDYEVIVIDSSPTGLTQSVVQTHAGAVHFERSRQRLLPHAARNRGAVVARGEVLVFTDADISPQPDWLDELLRVYCDDASRVVAGAIACRGVAWVDLGAHFCKFDKWLPGGQPKPTDISPTASMLCHREVFAELGGFPEGLILGDTVFSWLLTQQGYQIWFAPSAVACHHHLTTWWGLVRERFSRGSEFAHLRIRWGNWSRPRVLVQLTVTLIPLRLVKLVSRVAINAWRAGLTGKFLWTLPIVITGQAAWLAGEVVAYLKHASQHSQEEKST